MKRTHCLSTLTTLACLLAIVAGCDSVTPEDKANPNYLTSFRSPPTTGTHGQQITVTVCTTNSAQLSGANMASFTDLYINTSPIVNGSAVLLATDNVFPLLAKAYTNWTVIVTIPTNQTLGVNYLIAVCNDNGHTVIESSYTDNTNSCPITIN